jgi:hypothetical protein
MRSLALDEKQPCERPSWLEVRGLRGSPVFCPAAESHFRCSSEWMKKEEGRGVRPPKLLLRDFSVSRQSIQPVLGRCRFLPVAVVLDEATQNLCGLFVMPCGRERLGEQ